MGGWPTIRYYNKKTGEKGGDFVPKTNKPVCTELGPEGGDNLLRFIEEASSVTVKTDL